VFDPGTGSSVRTTATGTVSLAFVQSSRGVVYIGAEGYEPAHIDFRLSFADTIPMTVLLRRKSP
jgi:hypothetical protein